MNTVSPDGVAQERIEGARTFDAGPVALEVERVGKEYPSASYSALFRRRGARPATRALADVSFQIREGEMVGLLGPNGAGKTTLLKILSTSLQPTEGRVLLYGQDIAREPRFARGRLGLITCDERSFYWRLSGRRNLRFFAALYQVPPRETDRRIDELLDALGLSSAAERPFHSYSSGMKQKLAIARGLLAEPSLLLYDEPTRSLDPLSAANIRNWITANRARNRKRTHLIATNLLNEAEQLCDRVLIVDRGRLIASGPIAEIRRKWAGDERTVHMIAYSGDFDPESLGGMWKIEALPAEGGIRNLRLDSEGRPDALSAVLAAILARGGVVLDCRSQQASFDEIFCSLVSGASAEIAENAR